MKTVSYISRLASQFSVCTTCFSAHVQLAFTLLYWFSDFIFLISLHSIDRSEVVVWRENATLISNCMIHLWRITIELEWFSSQMVHLEWISECDAHTHRHPVESHWNQVSIQNWAHEIITWFERWLLHMNPCTLKTNYSEKMRPLNTSL